MLKKKKGFTLIELLVVISIIAVLMSIMMPALKRVREQAKTVVCSTNIHQFSLALGLYANDNNGKMMPYIWNNKVKYFWMESLRSSYGDSDKLKFCPSVKTEINNFAGNTPGSAKLSWHFRQQSGTDLVDDYGSYGMNGWMYDSGSRDSILPGSSASGGYGDKTMYWCSLNIPHASEVPVFMDSTWVDFWPISNDCPPERSDGVNDANSSSMSRVCFDRHNKHINVCFADLSLKKSHVRDLWGMRWNKRYEKNVSRNWPDWMK